MRTIVMSVMAVPCFPLPQWQMNLRSWLPMHSLTEL